MELKKNNQEKIFEKAQKIFDGGGINPEKYQGFAFGLGIERTIMAKYGIEDIRHFLNSDLGMIEQFN